MIVLDSHLEIRADYCPGQAVILPDAPLAEAEAAARADANAAYDPTGLEDEAIAPPDEAMLAETIVTDTTPASEVDTNVTADYADSVLRTSEPVTQYAAQLVMYKAADSEAVYPSALVANTADDEVAAGAGDVNDGSNDGGEAYETSEGSEEPYPPEVIAESLRTDRWATLGITPAATEQNQRLLAALSATAEAMSDDVLGLQVVGSRVTGTCLPDSDVDILPLCWDTTDIPGVDEALAQTARSEGVKVDHRWTSLVPGTSIKDPGVVPSGSDEFIGWVERCPTKTTILFDNGIYHGPELPFVRLAAVEVISSYPKAGTPAYEALPDRTALGMPGGPRSPDEHWEVIRVVHSMKYLGETPFVQNALIERLGEDQAWAVETAISPELLEERHARFGLPSSLAEYRQQLITETDRLADDPRAARGRAFLDAVRRDL